MGFLEHRTLKEGLENMMLRGQIEGKWVRGKQLTTFLSSLSEWMAEYDQGELTKRQDLLRATNDRELWRALITTILKGHGAQKKKKKKWECLQHGLELTTKPLVLRHYTFGLPVIGMRGFL